MVNTTSSTGQRGLNDWLVQRFSAVYMACCFIGLIIFLVVHPNLSFFEWRQLFSTLSIKAVTVLFFASLLWHAWIGMWTIFTDYIKCGCLRTCIQAGVLFFLGGFFIAAVMIVWSI